MQVFSSEPTRVATSENLQAPPGPRAAPLQPATPDLSYACSTLARRFRSVNGLHYAANRFGSHKNRQAYDKFIETYVKCSLKVCEERDVKGMYKKARTKEITNFTGIDDAYDIPKHPDIILETENISVEESIKTMLNHLHSNGFLNSSG